MYRYVCALDLRLVWRSVVHGDRVTSSRARQEEPPQSVGGSRVAVGPIGCLIRGVFGWEVCPNIGVVPLERQRVCAAGPSPTTTTAAVTTRVCPRVAARNYERRHG